MSDNPKPPVITAAKQGLRVSIRYQTILSMAFLVFLTMVTMSIVVLSRQKEELFEQTVSRGKIVLTFLTENSRGALLDDDVLSLNTLLKQVADVDGMIYGIIVDRKEEIKAHTVTNFIGTPYTAPESKTEEQKDGNVSIFQHTTSENGEVLNISQEVIYQGVRLGQAHVGISLNFINDRITAESLVIILVGFLVLSLGVGLGIFLGMRFTRPIEELVHATQAIAKGDFEHRITTIRQDELGDLGFAVNQMSEELKKKDLIQTSFGKYVGSDILELILADPNSAILRGMRGQATVLFTDVRGFTAFSEKREPEKVVEALNDYFAIATQAILEEGGYVDKFIGDAVLGVFGVPLPNEKNIEMALRAAWKMQTEFLNHPSAKDKDSLLAEVGIGINYGTVVSGNIGSSEKLEYTVIGDAVNVASRLNSLAGSQEIIISESAYEPLKDKLEVSQLGPQSVKGKSEKIHAYKLTGINFS